MKIAGASALIAGGASGLGAATVRALHEAGATVVIADLAAEKGAALAAELGGRARFVEANVTESEAVQAAVGAAAERDGGLRICVCCAGIGWATDLMPAPRLKPLEQNPLRLRATSLGLVPVLVRFSRELSRSARSRFLRKCPLSFL